MGTATRNTSAEETIESLRLVGCCFVCAVVVAVVAVAVSDMKGGRAVGGSNTRYQSCGNQRGHTIRFRAVLMVQAAAVG
jgi:hypothetical protein